VRGPGERTSSRISNALWPSGSIEEARVNLIEALTLFFESAAPSEVGRRLHDEVFVTQVEVPVG
jgi:hypothetical protein